MKRIILLGSVFCTSLAWAAWPQAATPSAGRRAGAAQASENAMRLELDKTIEREMQSGQTDAYRIHIQAGQFVHVVLLQKGISAVVTLRDPSGKEIAKFDSLNGAHGHEPVSAIAEVSGDYRVEIKAGEGDPGHYEVQVTDLRDPTASDPTRIEAERVYMEGAGLYRKGDEASYRLAAEKWQQSLALWQSLNDKYGQATSLFNVGSAYDDLKENNKALVYYEQALALFRAVGDNAGEAATLHRIGSIYDVLGDTQKALESYKQALPLYRSMGERGGEGRLLANIGRTLNLRGDHRGALENLNRAVAIFRFVHDPKGEAFTELQLGLVYDDISDSLKALDSFGKALEIYRQMGDRRSYESYVLGNIGGTYLKLSEYQKAFDYLNQALTIARQIADRDSEAWCLTNIAITHRQVGEMRKSLSELNQSLQIFRENKDSSGEAQALMNLAMLYDALDDRKRALGLYTQVLPIFQQLGDRDNEAKTLLLIGEDYYHSGEGKRALRSYQGALSAYRAVGDRDGEACTLDGIGAIYDAASKNRKALAFYSHSLSIYRDVADRDNEAEVLGEIGELHRKLGESREALDSFKMALPIAIAVNDPLVEANIFHSLMLSEKRERPELAIFDGKQAVNYLQNVRGNMQTIEKRLQKSFVASTSDYYRDLANLLIDQGRLPESEQVMDLLKEAEYDDFVRGEKIQPTAPLSLTPAEEQAEEEYQRVTTQLLTHDQRWSELKKNMARTDEEEKEFQQLTITVNNASTGLQAYYDRLYALLGSKNSSANLQMADVKGDVRLLQQTVAEMPHTVALRTVVSKERFNVLVVVGSGPPVGRKYEISEEDLNHKVALFARVLRDPTQDPRPLAQELYKIVVGPVQEDLDQARAQIIVWSLDGVLRYIPMAALYDGRNYLVEKYSSVIVTPASMLHLRDQPEMKHLSAVAMGISRKYEDDLNPLPTVISELKNIVSDPQIEDANGVLPGSILLNGQFTERGMEDRLNGQPQVVHIASHFVLEPGDANRSYLLLAGKDKASAGYHLTVAEFRDNQNLNLQGADLLTLSACETGMGGNKAANGEEVEGLGEVAQQDKGAKAVISSLWKVYDTSTGALMADFYKRWASGGGNVTKVEALRQAQLDLLEGRIKPALDFADPSAPTSFAHPYYWAPFILTGNWR
jgi:CHAT domain-containing protein/predicted DNA-binding protein YlxM (UPF0122 family)